jgi:hypothetical protein
LFGHIDAARSACAVIVSAGFSTPSKYRIRRAVERRGRPITDDRLDVEVALLLCHWFGGAVLG